MKGQTIKRITALTLALTMVMALGFESSFAHSGRTNKYGYHKVRTPGYGRVLGSYHFHH